MKQCIYPNEKASAELKVEMTGKNLCNVVKNVNGHISQNVGLVLQQNPKQ